MKQAIHHIYRSFLKVSVLVATVAVSAQTFASSSAIVEKEPVSVEATAFAESPVFKIFPNPSDGESIGLVLDKILNQQAVITIYNSIGSRVYHSTVPAKGASKTVNVKLDKSLRKGLYLLTFSIGESHHTERLVVK